MTLHRLLAHLGALGLLSACASSDPVSPGSGGTPATAGATTTTAGASGSGVGGTSGAIGSAGTIADTGGAGTGGAIAGSPGSGGSGTAGTGTAGMPAAGTGGQTSGGGSTSSSVGCPAGIGLCDDFESYAEGTAPFDVATSRWMKVRMSPGLTLTVDSMKASSGTKALHITGTDLKGGICNTCGTSVISTKPGDAAFGAAGSKSGFVRFMMFLKTFTQSGSTHGRIVRVGPDTVASLGNAGTPAPQAYAQDLHFNKPATFKIEKFNDVYFGSVDPVPLEGKWVCWEFEVGPTTLNWWRDGTLVTNSTKFPGGLTLTAMAIGFETYTPLTAIDFWLDDVAFDATKRIGCPVAK